MTGSDDGVERPLHVVIWLILLILAAYVVTLIFGNTHGGQAATIALACLAVGALFGFIFAIPKRTDVAIIASAAASPSGQSEGVQPAAQAAAAQEARGLARSAYRANTSLEEISDWLTKIVVGIGLVQARDIGLFIQAQGREVAPILFGTGASAFLGSAMIVATFLMSFLASYLYFRLCLAEEFTRSDSDAARVAERAEKELSTAIEEGRAQAKSPRDALSAIVDSSAVPATAGGAAAAEAGEEGAEDAKAASDRGAAPEIPANPSDPAFASVVSMGEAINRKLAEMRDHPKDPSDPVKGMFGGSSTVNTPGRRTLTAKVREVPGMEQWYRIDLKLTSGPPKLEGDVTFFYHPTFPQLFERAQAHRGQAAMQLYAYGPFTVGVLADGGSTELELDLGELPDAPKAFREG